MLPCAVACSADANKGPPLVVCEAGKNGCPDDTPTHPKQGSSPTDTPGATPTDPPPPASPTPASSPPPASQPTKTTPDPSPSKDPPPDPTTPTPDNGACAALAPCCAAIRAAGITGTADNCDRVAAAGDGAACDTELKSDGKADDFFDPPPACLP
jgi:hypothetical protein